MNDFIYAVLPKSVTLNELNNRCKKQFGRTTLSESGAKDHYTIIFNVVPKMIISIHLFFGEYSYHQYGKEGVMISTTLSGKPVLDFLVKKFGGASV